MKVDSFSFGFVVDPLSLVDISSGLDESSLSVGHVVGPVSLVKGSVLPDLPAHPPPHAFFPLSIVDGSVVKFYWRLFLIVVGLRELELSQSLIGGFDGFRTYLGEFFK